MTKNQFDQLSRTMSTDVYFLPSQGDGQRIVFSEKGCWYSQSIQEYIGFDEFGNSLPELPKEEYQSLSDAVSSLNFDYYAGITS